MTTFNFPGKSSRKAETPRSSSIDQYPTSTNGSSASSLTATNLNPAAFAPEKTVPSPPNFPPMESRPPLSGARPSAPKGCLLDQKPESMVAESLKMKGELEFTRLLRVDGRFEGELITDKGSLVVGPKGEVVGDLKNMQEVYVEGVVRGSVYANDVKIKNNGMLFGDIQCFSLTLDPTASIKGVADTATLKERAVQEANAAASASSSMSSPPPVKPPTIANAKDSLSLTPNENGAKPVLGGKPPSSKPPTVAKPIVNAKAIGGTANPVNLAGKDMRVGSVPPSVTLTPSPSS